MKKYTYLLFDLDHTLFDTDTAERIALKETFERLTQEVTEEMYQVYRSINKDLWNLLERGEISQEEIKYKRFESWLEHFKIDADVREISGFYLEALSRGSQLFEGAKELLISLKASYRLVAITNGLSKVQRPRIVASGLNDLFDSLFISEELAYAKPDIKYFELVIKEIEAKDQDCLIIGDSMSSDILGGIQSGIDTCYLNFHEKKETPYQATYEVSSYKELHELLLPLI